MPESQKHPAKLLKPRPARPDGRQALGRQGEQLAAETLAALGYAIVTRNYGCRAGEIDLVTRLGETWVFVEVRARRNDRFGPPEASITARKKKHLLAAAQTYLQAHGLVDVDWRIDLVAIEFNAQGRLDRIDVIENAINEQ